MRVGTAVALVLFLLLATYGRPWHVFDRGPFTSDFYDEQAYSLVHGRLDVDHDIAGIEGFQHAGKTYLYFGIVPSLFHAPTAAVTDALDGRLVIVSMLGALWIALLSSGRLLWRARRWLRPDDEFTRRDAWVGGVFVAAVGLASPLLFLGARALVYHEAIAWGVAFTLLTFELAFSWWERQTTPALVFMAIAAVAAFNSRSSVGLGAAIGVFLLVIGSLRRLSRRQLAAAALAVVAPFLLYSAVNIGRFGHPVRIPWYAQGINRFDPHRVEMLNRNNGTTQGPQFVPTTAADYLRPDGIRLQRLFPWITFRDSTHVFGAVEFDVLDRASSIESEATALCVLAAIGFAAVLRKRRHDAWPWALLLLAGVAGIGPTLALGFTANRYLADFLPPLVVAAAIGTWWLRDRRVLRAAIGVLAVVNVGIVGALTLQSQRLYLLPKDRDRLDFVRLQYDLDDRLSGGAPPMVQRGDALPAQSTDATVFIVGECRQLFWGDGRSWFPLEPASPGGATPLCDQLRARLDSNS